MFLNLTSLARRLLIPLIGTVWMVLLSNGCLLPQDDYVLPERPPSKKNHPPRIVLSTVSPPSLYSIGNDESCEAINFSAYVVDEDGDRVRVRWYHYPPGRTDGTNLNRDDVLVTNTEKITSAPARTTLSSDPRGALNEAGIHHIELIVCDVGIVNKTCDRADDGTLRYEDKFLWVIDVKNERCK